MSDIEVLEWSNLIKADFRERIRVETHGLSPAAARAVSETLAAERDAYLAKVEDYAADLVNLPLNLDSPLCHFEHPETLSFRSLSPKAPVLCHFVTGALTGALSFAILAPVLCPCQGPCPLPFCGPDRAANISDRKPWMPHTFCHALHPSWSVPCS